MPDGDENSSGAAAPPLKAGHTPGPWRADEYGVRDRGGYICKITWPSRYPDQNERYAQEIAERTADARLIAVAPDLLAALMVAASIIGHPDDAMSKHIQDVIAKAKGETP